MGNFFSNFGDGSEIANIAQVNPKQFAAAKSRQQNICFKRRVGQGKPGERFEKMPLGDEVCPVLTTAIGRVGLMLAADGYVPEVARSLMLRGAEIILWSGDDPGLAMAPVARTRAEENRIFVASAAAPSASGATLIADPNGRLLAVALDGQEICVAAEVNRALSHIKERAPGTDVVRNRQPATYGAITRVAVSAAAAGAA